MDGETVDGKETEINFKVVSLGQDIFYGVSGRKNWTPKHIGLVSTLH